MGGQQEVGEAPFAGHGPWGAPLSKIPGKKQHQALVILTRPGPEARRIFLRPSFLSTGFLSAGGGGVLQIIRALHATCRPEA